MKTKAENSTALFILALICLVNPSVHVVDIFPDFIAYIIIARMLKFAAERAPYFAEAKLAFIKLAALTAAKIPAFFIIVYSRQQVAGDNDIYALFAFSFAVIEAVLVYSAVSNLFSGLFYLGERGDARSLIIPYPVSKKRGKYASVEGLRFLTFAFMFFKCAAYSLPELLILTRSVDAGSYATTFNFARLYPYTILLMLAATIGFGTFWARHCAKYRAAVLEDGGFDNAIEELFDESGRASLDKKLWLGGMRGALTFLCVTSFFTVEIIFSDFRDINLLPHFIFAVLFTVAAYRLSGYVEGRGRKAIITSGIVYTVVSAVAYFLSAAFLTDYSYESLVNSAAAREAYLPVVISAAVEFIALVVMLVFVTRMLIGFSREHTGVSPNSERYMRSDAAYHGSICRKGVIWAVLGGLSGLAKTVQVFLRSHVRFIYVDVEGELGGSELVPVAETVLPWFGVVVATTTVLFIAYSLHYFGVLKGDAEIKYGSD